MWVVVNWADVPSSPRVSARERLSGWSSVPMRARDVTITLLLYYHSSSISTSSSTKAISSNHAPTWSHNTSRWTPGRPRVLATNDDDDNNNDDMKVRRQCSNPNP